MIQTYIGEGLASLAEKLQELWSFKKTETDDAGVVDLWISDEIYIRLNAAQCIVGGTGSSQTSPISGATDTYHWKIIQTKCGIAFGPESMAHVFIGRTVRFDGVESIGCIARPYNALSYYIYADSQAANQSVNAASRFIESDHYTQLYPATCPSANVYYPDIYFIAQSPQATNRITQIGADIYFCNEFIALRDTPAQTSTGGESVDLSNYYTAPQTDTKIRAVEQVIAELETDLRAEIESMGQSVESLAAEVTSVSAKADAAENAVTELSGDLSDLGVMVEEVENAQKLYAAPMQDATVEGRFMLFAEYVFPQKSNYESADVTFLVRNRGVNSTAEDGVLRVRLRYGKSAQAYQYAQIYFTQCSGLDAAKIILCCNGASGTAQLWLDASTAYAGYIFKVLDMGTSASIVDYTAWTLYSPTTGAAELPSEAYGWAAVTATAPSADTAATNL